MFNNSCISQENIVKNCYEYDKNETCVKCVKVFAFKEDNKSECIRQEYFQGYYSMDEGISYYPCEEVKPNCSKCYYNTENNTVKCMLCKDGSILLNEEGGNCFNKSLLENNTKYVFANKTHAEICSNIIPDCEECENIRKCKKCKDGYYFNNLDNICLFKENVTKNYPEVNNVNKTNTQGNDNNDNKYIFNVFTKIIQIVYIVFLL